MKINGGQIQAGWYKRFFINDLIYESSCYTNFLITQSVYYLDIFQNIIDKIYLDFSLKNKFIQFLDNNELYNSLNDHWKNKKYFNKNKQLSICFTKINNINNYFNNIYSFITNDQKNKIIDQLINDYGLFTKDFENKKNYAIIFINLDKCINDKLIIKYLIHEFIHYLQWNTGKIIKLFKQFNIDLSINRNKLFFDYFKQYNLQDKLKNIINNIQSDTYIQAIYYDLKNIRLSKNLEFNHNFLSQLIYDIQDISKFRIDTFMRKFVNTCKQYQIQQFLNTDEYLYLVTVFFLHLKINTFKNYIYGYYFKEFKK